MKSSNHTSVFYDPKGKRWNIFLTCFSAIGFCVIFVLSFLCVQIINVEKLPPITLPQSVKGEVFTSDGKTLTKFASVDRKKVALTFDDGPDKRNTPEILDILKEYEVPATFFIVGSNANSEIDLLHRIYDEGHELGNHTYTHLNMENASLWRQKIEINATQKILQSQLGISSAIFRAPYSDDHDPHTQKQLLPVKVASELGYLSVGMKIDPNDWQVKSKDELVQKVLTKVREGHGNIILLHDGGDDRTKTIAALPIIIDQLKKEGYTFVSMSQLIGIDSAHIPLSNSPLTQINNQLASLGFGLLRFTNQGIFILALISIVFGVLRFILIIAFAIVGKRLAKAKRFDHNFTPKVAAIVPAYNEEKVITKTIDSLVESDYPNLEVIVVDDGSSDNTFEIVKRHTKNIKNIKDFRKENGGKSSAINFGLSQTIADIVVIIDADTILKHDAISKLVRHFKDPAVGAVAGNAKVGNRVNFLTKLQAIEYITSQNLERRAFSVFNCIRVVAGAIGAWRKDLIIQAGLFTNDTLAEDTDMTLRILRLGYRVDYEADAIAFTEAPQTVKTFMRQRFRWMHGTFQAIWKHIDTLFKPSYGAMGAIAIPDILIFQVIFPLFAPLMDFFLVYNLILTASNILDHPNNFSLSPLFQALYFYSIFMFFDYASATLAFAMEKKENRRLLALLLLQRFIYRQLLYISSIKSTLAAIKGNAVMWNKLERFATVPQILSHSYDQERHSHLRFTFSFLKENNRFPWRRDKQLKDDV